MVGVLGDNIPAKCSAELSVSVSGCVPEYDNGFATYTVPAGVGINNLFHYVTISSADEYIAL